MFFKDAYSYLAEHFLFGFPKFLLQFMTDLFIEYYECNVNSIWQKE